MATYWVTIDPPASLAPRGEGVLRPRATSTNLSTTNLNTANTRVASLLTTVPNGSCVQLHDITGPFDRGQGLSSGFVKLRSATRRV